MFSCSFLLLFCLAVLAAFRMVPTLPVQLRMLPTVPALRSEPPGEGGPASAGEGPSEAAPSEFFLSILAIHRDDESLDFLQEWVEHHTSQVDHIYLVVHQAGPQLRSPGALAQYISRGFVSVRIYQLRPGQRFVQRLIMNESKPELRSRFVAVIDTDEFLVAAEPGRSARSLLQRELSQCDKVRLHWLTFISRSRENPKSARADMVWRMPLRGPRYKKSGPGLLWKFGDTFKTISRLAAVQKLKVHTSVMAEDARVCQEEKNSSSLLLFHYRLRSWADLLHKRRNFQNRWKAVMVPEGRKSQRHWREEDAEEDEKSWKQLVKDADCQDTFLAEEGRRDRWGARPGDSERCFGPRP